MVEPRYRIPVNIGVDFLHAGLCRIRLLQCPVRQTETLLLLAAA